MRKRINEGTARAMVLFVLMLGCSKPVGEWKPDMDWGHWRLGQRSRLEFLKENRFTLTFGSGAPLFENVSREEFDDKMNEARAFNRTYHDSGYIVLRYLSTSLNGSTAGNTDIPCKDQIDMLDFYNERWTDYQDYLGPKPQEDPTTWITVRPDGSFPFYRYAPYGRQTDEGFETWGCPNNPSYVRWMEGRVRAQAETGIDGSYVDWTQIAGGTCYCRFCIEAFRKYLQETLSPEAATLKYGTMDYTQVTPPRKRGDPFWMEWITFRCRTVALFHQRLRTVARKYNPDFMISGNVFGGFGYGPIAYDAAGNMELLGNVDDFIYSEIQEYLDNAPRKNENGVKITNSPALKFLAAASHGKPVIVYATEITPPIFPNPTEQCLSAMAQINIAEAVANHTLFREKRETPAGATAMYRFLAENENYLKGGQLSSNVGIMASLTPYFADEVSFAFSTSRVLADNGIAHCMLLERDVKSGLDGIDLLILPYLPLLDLKTQDVLHSFVLQGGILYILGECGVKDRNNRIQTSIPLLEMLEVSSYPDDKMEKSIGKGKVVFQPLVIPPSRFLVPARDREGATTFGPAMADVFPDIPEAYTRNRMDPGLRKELEILNGNVISLLGDRMTRILSGMPYLEMTVMENKSGDLLVHLVNYDVTLDGYITPASAFTVQVLLPPGKEVRQIQCSSSLDKMVNQSFETIGKGNQKSVVFRPPDVEVYGLTVVTLR